MSQKKHNKKLPRDAVSNNEIEPKYGFIHGYWHESGSSEWYYENPEDQKTFHQKVKASGSYHTTEYNSSDKEIHTSLTVGEHRGYVAGGKSTHVDGHHDINSESTYRVESAGDNAFVTAKDHYHGVGGKKIQASKNGRVHVVAGSSDGTDDYCVEGTERKTVTKDSFTHIKGRQCVTIEKEHLVINNGDKADYYGTSYDSYAKKKMKFETGDSYQVVSANTISTSSTKATTMSSNDTFSATAKKDMSFSTDEKYTASSKKDMSFSTDQKASMSAKQDISFSTDAKINLDAKSEIVLSDTSKITIKVGGSKITISSSGIEISGSKISIKSDDPLELNGKPTNVNGGGMPAIPFTVP